MKLREIKLTPPIVAISAMLLALTSAAAPKIVYVTPSGAGAKDGTSWENAFDSVSNAYASAAAYVAAGCDSGEVWVRKGLYVWSKPKTYCIKMQSHVSVRGGFAGDETLASQADPKKNVTVFSGDFGSDDIWLPNGVAPAKADQIKIWGGTVDDPVLNEPNPDDKDEYWAVTQNINDCGTGFSTDASVEDCEFSGVWFSCFVSDGVALAHPSTNIRFVNCGFVGNNTGRNGASYDGGVVLKDTHATFTECEFVNNHNCVLMKHSIGSAPDGKTLFKDCVFRRTVNSVVYCSRSVGGAAEDNVYAFENCVFEKNRTAVYYMSGTKAYTLLFSDCTFWKNAVSGSGGIIGTSGKTDVNAQIRLDRCEFTDNTCDSAVSGKKSVCLWFDGIGKIQSIRDCYFACNAITYSGVGEGCAAICAITAASHYPAFVNCTFEDNVATATDAGAYASMFSFASTNTRMGFGNCVFINSQMTAADETKAAEVYSPAPAAGAAIMFVNSIFTNAAASYQPYRQGGGTVTNPKAFGMAVPDLSKINLAAYDGKRSSITNLVPKLSATVKKGANGAKARGVDWDSPYRKAGFPFVMAANGYDYYVDSGSGAKPWYALCGGGTSTAADIGITDETPLVLDAFGASRVRGKVAYGPLNAPDPGLMLLLR